MPTPPSTIATDVGHLPVCATPLLPQVPQYRDPPDPRTGGWLRVQQQHPGWSKHLQRSPRDEVRWRLLRLQRGAG